MSRILDDSMIASTYENQAMAELASGFLVNSQANSKLTGSSAMLDAPLIAMSANKAAVLLGLTVHSGMRYIRSSIVQFGGAKAYLPKSWLATSYQPLAPIS
jgi:hypothetical protein